MKVRSRRALVGIAVAVALALVGLSLKIVVQTWSAACCAYSPTLLVDGGAFDEGVDALGEQ